MATTTTQAGLLSTATPDPLKVTADSPVQQASTTNYAATKLPDPTKWTTTPDQTVAGQLSSVIDENNPLQQQAKSRALRDANSRGLLNSSMAVTAGQSALYDAAMPIAQADAANASKTAGYNADTSNQFKVQDQNTATQVGLANAAANNQTSQFNAGQTNQAQAQQVQQGFDLAKMDKAAAQTLAQMSAQQQNDLAKLAQQQGYNLQTMSAQQINDLAKMATGQQYSLQTLSAQQQNTLAQMAAQQGLDLAKMDKQAALTLSQMSAQQANDMAQLATRQGYTLQTMNAEQANTLAKMAVEIEAADKAAEQKFGFDKQLLDIQKAATRDIATIEAQYKNLTQASASAASIVNGVAANVAKIMENTTMDAAAKQKAIDIYNANANKALQMMGAISGDPDLVEFFAEVLG